MSEKSGIFKGNFNSQIRPQDDLYRHVNGGWLDSAEIPSDRAADGAFYHLRDESEKSVRAIIKSLQKWEGNLVPMPKKSQISTAISWMNRALKS